jgi:hypothetical protein
MCMLTYLPENTQPDAEALWNGTVVNNDGHGFAIVHEEHIITRRGMEGDEILDKFIKMRRRFPHGPALFHSRMGTGGVFSRFNVHPFKLQGDRRTVVAHNGILPKSLQPAKTDRRCDTRWAADNLFPFYRLNKKVHRDELANLIGRYNKLVFLTTNPAYPHHSYIINEASGVWDHGIWYSNYDYLPYVDYEVKRTDEEEHPCPYCGQIGDVDEVLSFCNACGLCLDCGSAWASECQCYNPGWERMIRREIDQENGYDGQYVLQTDDNGSTPPRLRPISNRVMEGFDKHGHYYDVGGQRYYYG